MTSSRRSPSSNQIAEGGGGPRLLEARAQIRYNHSFLLSDCRRHRLRCLARTLSLESAVPYFTPHAINNNGVCRRCELPLDLNYEVDLWGRIQAHRKRFEGRGTGDSGRSANCALLSLQAELAVDYFEARANDDADEKLLLDTVKSYEEAYRITNNRFQGGSRRANRM